MLILSRAQDESIDLYHPAIPGRVRITATQIKGGKVRLGFEAPDEVKILRSEIPYSPPSETPAADGQEKTE